MSTLCQIKASAGSGKTHALTRKYLSYLCSCRGSHAAPGDSAGEEIAPAAFGDILAITFTNAAVEEMRSRVLGDLKKAALGLIELEGVGRPQAMVCLKALLRDLGQLNVRTIDSLLHQIVRTAALSLGLHPDFQPAFDAADALAPYLERFMRRAEGGDKEAIDLLAKAVRAYLTHLPENRKIFLPGRDLLSGINAYLDDVFCGRAANLSTDAEVKLLLERHEKRFSDAHVSLLAEFKRQEESCGIILDKRAKSAIEKSAAGKPKASGFNAKASVLDLLVKKSPAPENAAHLEELYADYRNAIKKITEIQNPFGDYLKFYPLIELARLLVAEHDADRQKGNTLPASLIPIMAARALDIDKGVCEGICRLGSRLSHFLVDEFQDTSLGQWQAFRPLAAEALGRGGALTWVGDVKQSIYGWRGAEPELFDAPLQDAELTAMTEEAQLLSLDYNRRSARQIIEHNNRIFGQLANPETAATIAQCLLPDNFSEIARLAQRVAANFSHAEQLILDNAPDSGHVRLECLGANDREFEEAFSPRLLDLLKNELFPGRRWSDILILVRDNEMAASLAALLLSEDIPVLTENSLLLAGHPIIEQSLAMLELIASPHNEQALHFLLTGSVCARHEAVQAHAAGLAECALNRGDEPLGDYVRGKYPAVWDELFAPFLDRGKTLTPYDAIREWYRKMRVEQRFPDERIFLRSFLELLHGAELRGIVTLNDFLDYWRRTQEDQGHAARAHMPEGLDAVRIMTIHKAKGLQAPVVILPLPARNLKVKTNRSGSNVAKCIDGLNVSVPLLKEYAGEYSEALMRDALETLNIIYVGFTRAEKALYIFTTDTPGSALAALAKNAGLGFPYSYGTGPESAPMPSEAAPPVPPAAPAAAEMCFAEPMGWLPNLKIARSWPARAGEAPTLKSGAQDAFQASQRGSLLHFCLEHMRIGENPEESASEALAFGLARSGLDLRPTGEERQKMLASLCWFAGQKEAAAWLGKGWKEQPLLDGQGRERRVDLLVPQEWGSLVLDYKSGVPRPEHEVQIREYMNCLEASGQFPGLIRGLLVYIDQRRFCLIAGPGAPVESATCPRLP